MAQLRSLMGAAADQIRTALSGNGVDVQVEPRRVWQPSPPTIDIYPADQATDPDYIAFGDPEGARLFVVRARVLASDGDSNQDLLYDLMDPEHELSVAVALLDDTTLNGWATSIDVSDPSGERLYETPDGKFYPGVEWTLTVLSVPS